MRKIVLLCSFIGLSAFAASAQSIKADGKKTDTWYLPHSADTDCKIHFKNSSANNVSVKYKKIASTAGNASWTFQVCDNFQCYDGLINSATTMPVKPNEVSELKITVNPYGKAGMGMAKYVIWDAAGDSTKGDTLTWYWNTPWGANTKSAQLSSQQIYPNPVLGNSFSVSTELTKGKIEVRDLSGKLLISNDFVSENQGMIAVDVSNLTKGVYTVSIVGTDNSRSSGKLIKL